MLSTAAEHYRRQQRFTAAGLTVTRRLHAERDMPRLVSAVTALQAVGARLGATSVPAMLAEQGIDAPPTGTVNPAALAGVASDGRELQGLLEQIDTDATFDLIVTTQLQDVVRVAAGVATTARPAVVGHVRYLNPPSCARCAILAGRFYRYSDGFLRHPRCDCQMVPTNAEPAAGLVSDPMAAFRDGQIRGLSAADAKALNQGSDISQVVNIRRREAGLTRAGGVIERGGRPTPEGIYHLARDRAEAISLLTRFGYLI